MKSRVSYWEKGLALSYGKLSQETAMNSVQCNRSTWHQLFILDGRKTTMNVKKYIVSVLVY